VRGELIERESDLQLHCIRIPVFVQIAHQGLGDRVDVMLAIAVGPDQCGSQAQRLGPAAPCVVETELTVHGPQGEVAAATRIGVLLRVFGHIELLCRNRAWRPYRASLTLDPALCFPLLCPGSGLSE
jgi:hypothetical protein